MSVGQILEFTKQLAKQREVQKEAATSDNPEIDKEPLVFEPTGSLIDTTRLDSGLVLDQEESAILKQVGKLFEQAVLPDANTRIDLEIIKGLHSCANMLIPLAPIYLASRMNTSVESLHSRLKQEESAYSLNKLIYPVRKFYSLQFIFFSYIDILQVRKCLGFNTYDDFAEEFQTWFMYSLEKTRQLSKAAQPIEVIKFKSDHLKKFIDYKFSIF